ncbi:MAG TPA: alpha/beta hydrolase [Pseudonocardia sp.]|jgi:pimeloyl-ACP methyl ester carboxylesterase
MGALHDEGLPGSVTRVVDAGGRGRITVLDTPGPLGAPTLVLLHGVTLDAATNWSGALPALAPRFRVLTLDLRGHGAGPPARVPYRLEDCADDVAAVVHALDVGPVVPVGYSMGGMVAQAFWRRHPALTAGLVLCATARNVSGSPLEQLTAMGIPFAVGALGWVPPAFPVGADLVGARLLGDGLDGRVRREVIARMRRMPLVTALAAMQAVCGFSSHRWIGGVDVPTAVVVARHDRVVPPGRQWGLARAVPPASLVDVVEIDGDHDVFLDAPGTFARALVRACRAVAPGGRGSDDTFDTEQAG